MTEARLAQLETLKARLRTIVFEDGPRGEKATRILRIVRARIEEAEAPARKAAAKARWKAALATSAYLAVALSDDTEKPRYEDEAHKRVADLCGSVEKTFRLSRLLVQARDVRVRKVTESEVDFTARVRKAFALDARKDGYSAEAVRAFLGLMID